MGFTLSEVGAKVVFEYTDGKVVLTDESVEFYLPIDNEDLEHGFMLRPAFSLSADNFDNVIAAYEQYHAEG